MARRSARQERLEKRGAVKHEAVCSSTAIACIDLDDEDVQAVTVTSFKAESKVKPEKIKPEKIKPEKIKSEKIKSELKKEMKAEPAEGRRREKKAKVKKEKPDDRDRSKQHDDGRKRHSRSRSRRRRSASRCRSSSSSSSTSTESESEMYRRLKPYTKVQLANLVRKADLNGIAGQVVHPSCAVSPCPPGCILVRLETGREVAVKPQNVIPMQSFHIGPHQAPLSQEARLHQVLKTIKVNVDNVMDRTMEVRESLSIIEGGNSGVPQGGIGHML